jgi:hypothetical protein
VTNYSTDPIQRFRWKVWIRRLRIETHQVLVAQGDARGITTWAKLQRKLLEQYGEDATIGRLQGILGVVHRGNDPHRLMRRIEKDELGDRVPSGANLVRRRASGPNAPDHERAKHQYLEVRTDLVNAGEKLCPGSADWENACLWTLTYPVLPRLEELRETIAVLKRRMDLLSPSLDEFRSHVSARRFRAVRELSHREHVVRYADSLAPLAHHPTANSLSLLAALVAESFITDNDVLLDLHRDAFNLGVSNLLAHPLMADIAREFQDWVTEPILTTAWQLPAFYHVSSLTEPFMHMDAWEKIVRKGRTWDAIVLESLSPEANLHDSRSYFEDE